MDGLYDEGELLQAALPEMQDFALGARVTVTLAEQMHPTLVALLHGALPPGAQTRQQQLFGVCGSALPDVAPPLLPGPPLAAQRMRVKNIGDRLEKDWNQSPELAASLNGCTPAFEASSQ